MTLLDITFVLLNLLPLQDSVIIHTSDSITRGNEFGTSIENIGFIDEDDRPDLLIGDGGSDYQARDAGSVYIISSQDPEIRIDNPDGMKKDRFGTDATCLGDVNFDGFLDYLVGSPGSDAACKDCGAVWFFISYDEDTWYQYRLHKDDFSIIHNGVQHQLTTHKREGFGTSVNLYKESEIHSIHEMSFWVAIGSPKSKFNNKKTGVVHLLKVGLLYQNSGL